jgi:hypothetical protein
MKKLLATAILGLASLSVIAGGRATIEHSSSEGVNGAKNSSGYMINFAVPVTKTLDGGFQMVTSQTDGTNSVSTRFETFLTPKYNLGFATAYVRGSVGTRLNTAGSSEYYAVEPGIVIPLGNNFSTRIGYRYRAAFDSGVADTTRAERVGVNYALTKKDSITVRYDRVRGDTNQNAWNLAYTRGF